MKEKSDKKVASKKKKKFTHGLPVFNFHAAGIDIGDTKHDVAIGDGIGGHIVREFLCFTEDLEALVSWLVSEGITTVAMESTGVYWLNLYLLLEESGIEPYLVNAKHVKNVTGRKKDDTDAIWIQKLHSCGLLQKSFQPEEEIRVLRTYVRQRRNLLLASSDNVQRMQKALELMNIKLHIVISDILGKTGLQMIESILKGERDPDELIKLKDSRIKASDAAIKKSLKGIWRQENLFMLQQAYDGYMFYQKQVKECENKIKEILLDQSAKMLLGDITSINLDRKKKPVKNQFNFNARSLLNVIVGVDLCKIDGISEVGAVELISEIGLDIGKWKSHKHFSAWLNVAPNTKITGGKIINSKMQKKKNHAGQTLRMAASTLYQNKAPIGEYARKMKSKLGKKGGVVATAHKLARIIYVMMKEKKEYNNEILIAEKENWKQKRILYLEQQLKQLKDVA